MNNFTIVHVQFVLALNNTLILFDFMLNTRHSTSPNLAKALKQSYVLGYFPKRNLSCEKSSLYFFLQK